MRRAMWEWGKQTAPFSALDDATKPAAFVVEQISDKEFAIPMDLGFRYNPPEQDYITVTRKTLPSTDFASIPRYMAWLVSRHGRHTPAALVHDQLVKDGITFEERQRADRCFVEMMDELQVPFVLSRVMGTAVSLATRWRGPMLAKVGVVLWGVLAAVGIAALVVGLATMTPWLIALSTGAARRRRAALGAAVRVRCDRRVRTPGRRRTGDRRTARLLGLLGDRDGRARDPVAVPPRHRQGAADPDRLPGSLARALEARDGRRISCRCRTGG